MKQLLINAILFVIFFAANFMHAAALPNAYKVTWDSPSQDSLDSMPL